MHDRDASPPVSDASRRLTARQAVLAVVVCAVALLIAAGGAVRSAGEEEQPGVERDVLLALAEPAEAVADALPVADVREDATGFLDPDDRGAAPAVAAGGAGGGGITADAFDPRTLGQPAARAPELRKLLVTGDSLSQPLDTKLTRRLADRGVRTVRQPNVGTGVSKVDLLDWVDEARRQAADEAPQAVVAFIGANEGFPLPGPDGRDAECCTPAWAAAYATRARAMMDAWRQGGRARVYWLLVPAPRDPDRQKVARAVNAAVRVAAAAYGAQVRVLDMADLFTPGFRYRDAMRVGSRDQVVRDPDGIHLNPTGSDLAADAVVRALGADFGAG